MSIFNADNLSSYPRIVTFSSEDITSGSNSIFQSAPIDLGVNDFDTIVLIDANIPKSFYNMPTGYNTFILREGIVNTTIILSVGSYNVNTLAIALKTALNTGSPNVWTYNVTYNSLTFHYDFSVTGNTSQPSIIMSGGFASPFRQLGFEDNSTNVFVTNKLSSSNALNLALVLTAYITSNIVQSTNNGILQQFLNIGSFPPMSVVNFVQIDYDVNAKRFDIGARNSWQFRLVDDLFLPIDTNGLPWSFTLAFFKRTVTHEIHQNELRLQNGDRELALQQQREQLMNDIGGLIEPNSSTVLSGFEDPSIKYPSE